MEGREASWVGRFSRAIITLLAGAFLSLVFYYSFTLTKYAHGVASLFGPTVPLPSPPPTPVPVPAPIPNPHKETFAGNQKSKKTKPPPDFVDSPPVFGSSLCCYAVPGVQLPVAVSYSNFPDSLRVEGFIEDVFTKMSNDATITSLRPHLDLSARVTHNLDDDSCQFHKAMGVEIEYKLTRIVDGQVRTDKSGTAPVATACVVGPHVDVDRAASISALKNVFSTLDQE